MQVIQNHGLADLRESGSLEQDADNIIFLYKENPDSQEITENEILGGFSLC